MYCFVYYQLQDYKMKFAEKSLDLPSIRMLIISMSHLFSWVLWIFVLLLVEPFFHLFELIISQCCSFCITAIFICEYGYHCMSVFSLFVGFLIVLVDVITPHCCPYYNWVVTSYVFWWKWKGQGNQIKQPNVSQTSSMVYLVKSPLPIWPNRQVSRLLFSTTFRMLLPMKFQRFIGHCKLWLNQYNSNTLYERFGFLVLHIKHTRA